MNKQNRIIRIGFLVLFTLISSVVWAKDPVFTKFLSSDAVSGYDPVAYFTQSRPVKGSDDFSFKYKDAKWYFSSQENLELFKSNPDKYAPQYGGYCAWAVAQGYTADGNPMNWAIRDGKLYLNYNTSIQDKWLKDVDAFIIKANQNWPKVLE